MSESARSKFVEEPWARLGPPVAWVFALLWAVAVAQKFVEGGLLQPGVVERFVKLPHRPHTLEYFVLAVMHMALAQVNMLIMLVEMVHVSDPGMGWMVAVGWGAFALSIVRDASAVGAAAADIFPHFHAGNLPEDSTVPFKQEFMSAACTLFARFGGWFGGMVDFHVILTLAMPMASEQVGSAMTLQALCSFAQHALMHREWIVWHTKLEHKGNKEPSPKQFCCQNVAGGLAAACASALYLLSASGVLSTDTAFAAMAAFCGGCILMTVCSCKDDGSQWLPRGTVAKTKVIVPDDKGPTPVVCWVMPPPGTPATPEMEGWEKEVVGQAFAQSNSNIAASRCFALCNGVVIERVDEYDFLAGLQACLRTRADWLGRGRDVPSSHAPYSKLALRAAWRWQHTLDQEAYKVARREVDRQRTLLATGSFIPIEVASKEWSTYLGMQLQPDLNEVLLLHGLPASKLAAVLCMGLDERYSSGVFGAGTYLAEDAGKCDQYCAEEPTASLGKAAAALFPGDTIDASKMCFLLLTRVLLGESAHTKDGKVCSDGKAALWADETLKRELSHIPGAAWPVPHHSLVADLGGKVMRYREFVQFHADRLYGEYIVAYERLP